MEEIDENGMDVIEDESRGIEDKQPEQQVKINDVFFNTQQQIPNDDTNNLHYSQNPIDGFVQDADRQLSDINEALQPTSNSQQIQPDQDVQVIECTLSEEIRTFDYSNYDSDVVNNVRTKVSKSIEHGLGDVTLITISECEIPIYSKIFYEVFIKEMLDIHNKLTNLTEEQWFSQKGQWLVGNTLYVSNSVGNIMSGYYAFIPSKTEYKRYYMHCFDFSGKACFLFSLNDDAWFYSTPTIGESEIDINQISSSWEVLILNYKIAKCKSFVYFKIVDPIEHIFNDPTGDYKDTFKKVLSENFKYLRDLSMKTYENDVDIKNANPDSLCLRDGLLLSIIDSPIDEILPGTYSAIYSKKTNNVFWFYFNPNNKKELIFDMDNFKYSQNNIPKLKDCYYAAVKLQIERDQHPQESPQLHQLPQLPQLPQSQPLISQPNRAEKVQSVPNGMEEDEGDKRKISDGIDLSTLAKNFKYDSSGDLERVEIEKSVYSYVPQGNGLYILGNTERDVDNLTLDIVSYNFQRVSINMGKLNEINGKVVYQIFNKADKLIKIRYMNDKTNEIFILNGVNKIGTDFTVQDRFITGRYAPTLLNKINTTESALQKKSQVIDFKSIKNKDVRILMQALDIDYYTYVAQSKSIQPENYKQMLLSNRQNLIHRLLYTTRLNNTSLNVNFSLQNDVDSIAGLPSYGMKSRANNLIGIMLLTNPPILISLTSKSHRGIKTIYEKYGTLSYVQSISNKNTVIRRHGKIVLQNRVIIGKSIRDNNADDLTDGCSNLEYKWINEILFVDGDYTVLIQIIPYLVNQSREDCYKYDIIAIFYQNGIFRECHTGHDFFIYEEGVNDYIQCLSNGGFNGFKRDVIPAALSDMGVCIPPITNMDKIFSDRN